MAIEIGMLTAEIALWARCWSWLVTRDRHRLASENCRRGGGGCCGRNGADGSLVGLTPAVSRGRRCGRRSVS
jgi:hypothetical protein